MPLDPIIARGVPSFLRDVPNTLLAGEEIARRRENTAELQRRNDVLERAMQDEKAQATDKEGKAHALAKLEWVMQSQNPKAAMLADTAAVEQFSKNGVDLNAIPDEQFPQFLQGIHARMAGEAGVRPEKTEPDRPKIGAVNPGDFTPASLAEFQRTGNVGALARVPPSYAPQQAPTGSWSAPFQAVGADGKPGLFTQHSITGQIRPVSVGGGGLAPLPKEGAAATANNPAGYNERQLAGLGMQQSNAISYAANLTGMSRDEMLRIYQTQGADGVAKAINEKGGRLVQGGVARAIQGIPLLGQTIVDVANPDLIAPRKGGGAGIALLQNPSGPITASDFTAGEAQFPGAIYPKEVQAEMVRQMLSNPSAGGQAGAAAQPPPVSKLKEGVRTTFANGQTWTLQGGRPVQVQ